MALTASQIVNLACQIAKCPGFTSQAGQFLNAILSDLSQTYDFEIARGKYSFTFNSGAGTGSGPYTLPADWLRGKDKSIFYTIDGVPYPMINIELDQFDDLVNTTGFNSYPNYYATDMATTPPVMYVWPPASGSYPVTARYYKQMADIATPETSSTVPWFQNAQYLITELSARLMDLTDDDRKEAKRHEAKDLLTHYLKMEGDRGGKVNQVQLDRRVFRNNFNRIPDTKNMGW
jgi:hypothetical protein